MQFKSAPIIQYINQPSHMQRKIINPHDEGISEEIKANSEPRELDPSSLTSSLLVDKTREMNEAYFNSLSELITHRYLRKKIIDPGFDL